MVHIVNIQSTLVMVLDEVYPEEGIEMKMPYFKTFDLTLLLKYRHL